MQWTVETWEEFSDVWDGVHNFAMAGEARPASFELPPLAEVIDQVRRDEQTAIGSGTKGRALLSDDIAERFRALPIEEAVNSAFSLAHYRLSAFDKPGSFLHGFREQVLEPWQKSLCEAGFTWDRCYPIIFISGPNCATNYHMDFSHVVACQVYGRKRFCGLKSPGRFAPWRARMSYSPSNFEKPAEITEDDTLPYIMEPGDVVWNAFLTPHWVEASESAAMSINFSHGGLRLNGRLCPFEQELEDFRAANPAGAPGKFQAQY